MNTRLKIVAGSIVGAVALHALSTFLPIRQVHAQPRQQRLCPNDWETTKGSAGVDIDGSWEPFAAVGTGAMGSTPTVVYRRCKP
jgi:hypothetical protein